MKPVEFLRRADRAQRSRPFKIIASAVVVVLAIAGVVAYLVAANVPVDPASVPVPPEELSQIQDESVRTFYESTQQVYRELLEARAPTVRVAVGACTATALALVVIWLGLGLTYLGLLLFAAAVVLPLAAFPETRGTARLLGGITVLAGAFTALIELLRLVYLALPGPPFAVARTVVGEAVRTKVSLLFIVLLILFMAWLPSVLTESTPLRYRVQAFLQYSTGLSFWLIGILCVLLATSSVAFEQRDRTIWQTMTKPVAPWQYILGKWLGIVGLAAVLLVVCGAAIFLFTEHLRGQKAHGEMRPFESAAGPEFTEDRRSLEFQVLQSRVSVEPEAPFEPNDPYFLESVSAYIEDQRRHNPNFQDTPGEREKVADDLYKQLMALHRAIEPGAGQEYFFRGLDEARERAVPILLRYKIDAGTNRPDALYSLSFIVSNIVYVRQAGLGVTHVIDNIPPVVIQPDGTVRVEVHNGSLRTGMANPETMAFTPKGGLEVSYSVGGWRINFLRVLAVLWVKLAFMAMLAVTAATFLSFPVACLVAFGTFIVAEGAGYLKESAEFYGSGTDKGLWRYVQMVVQPIAEFVATIFTNYANLRPTARLVQGQLLSWGDVALGTSILVVWTVVLFFIAVGIFRKRELAMYSGQ